ncbi:hypothetical protein ABZ656_12065 [Streptomyces sp. NPDC007095]|uniref:hypothetical protein n=1 Tax=Streptomyces sp. NPDC007095 TaxID=3154482 RepID=UPI0033D32287
MELLGLARRRPKIVAGAAVALLVLVIAIPRLVAWNTQNEIVDAVKSRLNRCGMTITLDVPAAYSTGRARNGETIVAIPYLHRVLPGDTSTFYVGVSHTDADGWIITTDDPSQLSIGCFGSDKIIDQTLGPGKHATTAPTQQHASRTPTPEDTAAEASASAASASASAQVSASAALASIQRQALARTYTVGDYTAHLTNADPTDPSIDTPGIYIAGTVASHSPDTAVPVQLGIVVTLLRSDGSVDASGTLCIELLGGTSQVADTTANGGTPDWTSIRITRSPTTPC